MHLLKEVDQVLIPKRGFLVNEMGQGNILEKQPPFHYSLRRGVSRESKPVGGV